MPHSQATFHGMCRTGQSNTHLLPKNETAERQNGKRIVGLQNPKPAIAIHQLPCVVLLQMRKQPGHHDLSTFQANYMRECLATHHFHYTCKYSKTSCQKCDPACSDELLIGRFATARVITTKLCHTYV